MHVLGGGGLHAVAGMRVWTPDVGILGNVGADFDPAQLQPLEVQSEGLCVTGRPTPRAWQLFEEDGTRTQVPRVSMEDWSEQLTITLANLTVPPMLQAAHCLSRGDPLELAVLKHLAERGVRLSMEPIIEGGLTDEDQQRVLACLPYVEICSPGLIEAARLTGEREPSAMVRALAERGPSLVALRQGAVGSLVYHRQSRQEVHVPPACANVVDVTGAGNAYCGGLLIGWVEHGRLDIAAAYAAVSAALTLEQIGPVTFSSARSAEVHARLGNVLVDIRLQGEVHV